MSIDILGNILHTQHTHNSVDPIDEATKARTRAQAVANIALDLKPNLSYSIRISDSGGKSPRGGFDYVVTVLAFPMIEGPVV